MRLLTFRFVCYFNALKMISFLYFLVVFVVLCYLYENNRFVYWENCNRDVGFFVCWFLFYSWNSFVVFVKIEYKIHFNINWFGLFGIYYSKWFIKSMTYFYDVFVFNCNFVVKRLLFSRYLTNASIMLEWFLDNFY